MDYAAVPSEDSRFSFLRNMPRLRLGNFPSPIKTINLIDGISCWVKDDGSCSHEYGGNKVRKLEFLLADARERRCSTLIVPGDIGSHTVLACCVHGINVGFKVTAVVYPHDKANSDEQALDRLMDLGVDVQVKGSLLGVLATSRWLAWRKKGYWVPFGASTPHSSLGYLAAAIELSTQMERGELPMVNTIFVPLGTGGTVAGLLAGFALLDLPIKIVAVQSVEAVFANRSSLKKQVRKLLALIGRDDLVPKAMAGLLRIDGGYLGSGYRTATDLSIAAVKLAAQQGMVLESAFSGKAMAALIDDVGLSNSGKIMFWNTHDQVGAFC